MSILNRSRRQRGVTPVLVTLEGRMLLNASMPHHPGHVHALEVHAEKTKKPKAPPAPPLSVIGEVSNGGYEFLNFNGPNAGNTAGAGTNMNGISNNGTSVGFDIDNNGNNFSFTTNPRKATTAKELNIDGLTTVQAFGTNSSGTVVGTTNPNGGRAFTINSKGKVSTFIPDGGTSALAFGINDKGEIVGQYTTAGGTTPGFLLNGKKTMTINAPAQAMGAEVVNAQSINNNGLVVGFYLSNVDGQVHGFMANTKNVKGKSITGTAIADPTIPTVAGEPGATFVFSQVLGINDHGIAVGYYGDSTTSQHGFIYNTHTGQYTFLDDPSEAFCNGVEVTQITGINNAGEITGFYSDANGVFHGFVAMA